MDDLRYREGAGLPGQTLQTLRREPGWALMSSAVVPGLGQAANKKWVRAGAYFLAEAAALTIHFVARNRARDQQRAYERFADQNWSVINYAQWLVGYYQSNNLSSQEIAELEAQVQGLSPSYNPASDWAVVELELLREIERNTPFVYPDRIGNTFSHTMPDYGSQQYYELISKYYQYGPGWRDFGTDRNGNPINSLYQLNWNGTDMPFNFIRGAELADRFNDSYRLAGNMVSLLILNHIVSAFDAYMTVKINNSRLETQANLLGPEMFTVTYHF